MACLTTSDWIALATMAATASGVCVVWLQTGKLSKQLTLQNFADYTKRYQEIILNFPEDINSETFILSGRDDYNKTMRYMRTYTDLCYEEWYLSNHKLIDKHVWQIWKGGMETAFSKSAFQQAWNLIKEDTKFGIEFESFIDSLLTSLKTSK